MLFTLASSYFHLNGRKYQSLLKPALHATAVNSLSDGTPSEHSADDVCIVFLQYLFLLILCKIAVKFG